MSFYRDFMVSDADELPKECREKNGTKTYIFALAWGRQYSPRDE